VDWVRARSRHATAVRDRDAPPSGAGLSAAEVEGYNRAVKTASAGQTEGLDRYGADLGPPGHRQIAH
jgi:hypothetical protein